MDVLSKKLTWFDVPNLSEVEVQVLFVPLLKLLPEAKIHASLKPDAFEFTIAPAELVINVVLPAVGDKVIVFFYQVSEDEIVYSIGHSYLVSPPASLTNLTQ